MRHLQYQPSSHRRAEVDHLDGVIRLIRRVCLLQEQGNPAQAIEIETTQLAEVVRAVRHAASPDFLSDERIQQLYTIERERVAEASVLVELLLPRIATAFSNAEIPAKRLPHNTLPTPSNRESPAIGGSPAIAELLDSMLAAERTGRRASQPVRQSR